MQPWYYSASWGKNAMGMFLWCVLNIPPMNIQYLIHKWKMEQVIRNPSNRIFINLLLYHIRRKFGNLVKIQTKNRYLKNCDFLHIFGQKKKSKQNNQNLSNSFLHTVITNCLNAEFPQKCQNCEKYRYFFNFHVFLLNMLIICKLWYYKINFTHSIYLSSVMFKMLGTKKSFNES